MSEGNIVFRAPVTKPLLNLLQNDRILERYWKYVGKRAPGECWPWLGGKNPKGYGMIKLGARACSSHRIALTLKLDRDIRVGWYACHSCDNAACCNPDHLWEGTPTENARDMVAKGRNDVSPRTPRPRAERLLASKLTADLVAAIRNSTESTSVLGQRYGVCRETVRSARTGETWAHIHPHPQARTP